MKITEREVEIEEVIITEDEQTMYDEHDRFLTAMFGEDVHCNYGWGQTDNGICSKVYGPEGGYVSTDRVGDHWESEFSPFSEEV